MGDTEFMAAIHHIVTPIARQFGPDLVGKKAQKKKTEKLSFISICSYVDMKEDINLLLFLFCITQIYVSAGFDAAEGHSPHVSDPSFFFYKHSSKKCSIFFCSVWFSYEFLLFMEVKYISCKAEKRGEKRNSN